MKWVAETTPRTGRAVDVAHRVIEQLDGGGAAPRAFHGDVLNVVAHQFAGCAAYNRQCGMILIIENGFCEAFAAAAPCQFRDAYNPWVAETQEHRAIVQSADQGLRSRAKPAAVASFFGKPQISRPPAMGQLSSRYIAWDVAALLRDPVGAAKAHRNDLASLGVIAKAGRVRHADELVIDGVANHFEAVLGTTARSASGSVR